jgi:hypothetical protein
MSYNPNFAQIGDSSTNNGGDSGARAAGFSDYADYLNKKAQNDAQSPSQLAQNAIDTANQNQQNVQNQIAGDKQSVTDFLTGYKADTANAISNANSTFNLPTLTSSVNALNSRISDLTSNYSNSGAGGYANANQVDAAINSRYLPQLSAQTANLNNASQQAQTQESIALAPDVAQGTLLGTQITTAMTGLTTTDQQSLDAVLAKLTSGQALTTIELNQANTIAQKALDNYYAIQQKQTVPASASTGQYEAVYDPATGKIVDPYMLASQNGGVYTP